MEFATQSWSPYLKRGVECLNKVQQRAIKLVKGLRKFICEDILCKLGLTTDTTLVHTWLTGDLLDTYSIITGKEIVKMEHFFEFSETGYNLRGRCYEHYTRRNKLEVRRHFFSQCIVNNWNQLASYVVEAPSVNAFKNRYDSMKRGAL